MSCSYIIPKTGNAHWQQERQCDRPAQSDGRCKIHNRERMYTRHLDKVNNAVRNLEMKLGCKLHVQDYGRPK